MSSPQEPRWVAGQGRTLLLSPNRTFADARYAAGGMLQEDTPTAEPGRAAQAITLNPAQLPLPAHVLDTIFCREVDAFGSDRPAALREARRALRPDGRLHVRATIVPGSARRGKQARQIREAGAFISAFLGLRYMTTTPFLCLADWRDLLLDAGFGPVDLESEASIVSFTQWAGASALSSTDRVRLRALVEQAPATVREHLHLETVGDDLRFRLEVARIQATSPA